MKYLKETTTNGTTYYTFQRRIPAKFQRALGRKMWRHGLGTDEHQAVVDSRRLTEKYDELLKRSPDEIFDESYAQKREEFEQIAGPLKAIINSPNLRPEARALLDERLPSWMNTPQEISSLLRSGLPAHVIRDNLEDLKALAFSRQPVESAHRQLWQAQLDVLTAQIDALKPDTVTVQKLLEQMIGFKKLKGSTPRKYRSHIDELTKGLGGDLPVKQVNRQQLRDHRDRLISDGLIPATVHAHFTAIKSVFSFAVEEELIDASPADRIRLPKDSRPIELSKWLPFTPSEMERILRGVDELWGKPLAGMPKERRVAFRTLIRVWTCHDLMPLRLLIYAAFASKASGFFQPRAECLLRGL